MEAIQYYDKCIQIRPSYIDAYNNKIFSLLHLIRNEEVIETTRNISILYCIEGDKMHERKSYIKAIQSYTKSITINSNNINAINRRKIALRDFYRNHAWY